MAIRMSTPALFASALLAVVLMSAAVDAKQPKHLLGLCTKDQCSATSGRTDYFKIPAHTKCENAGFGPKKPNRAYCAGHMTAAACCKRCTNTTTTNINKSVFNCRFWAHIPERNDTECQRAGCGRCVLIPADDDLNPREVDPEECDHKQMRLGKACPSGENDPHFVGAQGTHFDFNGLPDKSFCLFTDRLVHVNMAMRGYYDTRTEGAALVVNGKAVRTWIRQLGFVWYGTDGHSHTLVLTARDGKAQTRGDGFLASAVLDGAEMARLAVGESRNLAGGLVISFNGEEKSGPYDVDAYTVRIGDALEMDLRLRVAHPLLQTPEDAQTHINVVFSDVTPTKDVHGVIGQTYRSGREKQTADFSRLAAVLHHPVSADSEEGKGFLDGRVKDYETSSIIGADCRYTAFNGDGIDF